MTSFFRRQLRVAIKSYNQGFLWGIGFMTGIVLWVHFIGLRP
jgi:hypothetical protein